MILLTTSKQLSHIKQPYLSFTSQHSVVNIEKCFFYCFTTTHCTMICKEHDLKGVITRECTQIRHISHVKTQDKGKPGARITI